MLTWAVIKHVSVKLSFYMLKNAVQAREIKYINNQKSGVILYRFPSCANVSIKSWQRQRKTDNCDQGAAIGLVLLLGLIFSTVGYLPRLMANFRQNTCVGCDSWHCPAPRSQN